MARVTSELWVKAYLRRCIVAAVPAVVARRGDRDAGAIYLRIDLLDGRVRLLAPAPGESIDAEGVRRWVDLSAGEPMPAQQAADRLERVLAFDPDIWIVDIDSRDGGVPPFGNLVAD